MQRKKSFFGFHLFPKKQEKIYLTFYQTEAAQKEFEQDVVEENERQDKDYRPILQYSSNFMAIVVSCLLVGVCYWQWQAPPVYTQYEENKEQLGIEQPLAVDVKNNGLFGSMTIEVCDYENLAQGKLLINGEIAGSFQQKQLVVRVYPGDVLEIDTTAYLNSCHFRIVKKSSHIREELLEEDIQTENGYGWIGKISFK